MEIVTKFFSLLALRLSWYKYLESHFSNYKVDLALHLYVRGFDKWCKLVRTSRFCFTSNFFPTLLYFLSHR